jgi:tripartite-type tricarboxylate transporter receptor subunit TctC
MFLVVNAEAPYKNLADFIADAKARPGQLAYSSGGLYGMSHLPGIIFSKAAGLNFRHVPSGGGGPALTAVVSKHVDFNFPSPPTALPLIRGNKIKALAVIGGRRLKSAPNVPSAKELGINAEYYAWVGLLAPVKTPKPIVDKLRDALKKVVENKTFIEMIEGPGDEVQYLSGDGLAKYMVEESATVASLYRELIKEGAK